MATPATRIAGSFALFGVLWILVSDAILFSIFRLSDQLWLLESLKGLVFVALSTVLIWWVVAQWQRREQHRAAARAKTMAEHDRALDSLEEALFIVRDRTIVHCNAAVEDMFGYDRDEVVGCSTRMLHVDGSHFEEFGRRSEPVVDSGETFEHEMEMRRRDGSVFPTSHTVAPLQPDLGLEGGAVSVIRDETIKTDAERRRSDFYRHLQEARDRERARIAREIHDELGQALTGIKLDLSRVRSSVSDDEVSAVLAETVALVDGSLQTVRSLSTDLHPAVLDELGLVSALEWLAEQHDSRFDEGCTFRNDAGSVDLPEAAEVHVFRIVQEAITNAMRHADANQVCVCLGRDDETVGVEVVDDGSWTPPEAGARTLGLTGMRERARLINGALRVDGTRDGTSVHLVVPTATRNDA